MPPLHLRLPVGKLVPLEPVTRAPQLHVDAAKRIPRFLHEVDETNPEVLQRPIEPARPAWISGRPRGLVAGTALEEDEKGSVQAVGIGDLSREDA